MKTSKCQNYDIFFVSLKSKQASCIKSKAFHYNYYHGKDNPCLLNFFWKGISKHKYTEKVFGLRHLALIIDTTQQFVGLRQTLNSLDSLYQKPPARYNLQISLLILSELKRIN